MERCEITIRRPEDRIDRKEIADLVRLACEFQSTVTVQSSEVAVNAKSLLGVLSLGIVKGMTITLIADGTDETEALDGLCALIDTGFAE